MPGHQPEDQRRGEQVLRDLDVDAAVDLAPFDGPLPEHGHVAPPLREEELPEVGGGARLGDAGGEQFREYRLGRVEVAHLPKMRGEVACRAAGVGQRQRVGHDAAERLGRHRRARRPVLVDGRLADPRTGRDCVYRRCGKAALSQELTRRLEDGVVHSQAASTGRVRLDAVRADAGHRQCHLQI